MIFRELVKTSIASLSTSVSMDYCRLTYFKAYRIDYFDFLNVLLLISEILLKSVKILVRNGNTESFLLPLSYLMLKSVIFR